MPTPASPTPQQHDCARFDLITVSDGNGAHVLRYLRLCQGKFFGGNTWDRTDGFAPGIHEMRDLKGMLDLVGKIANTPAEHWQIYTLEGLHGMTRIAREMSVRDLSRILGCDEQAVRDHFDPLVALT